VCFTILRKIGRKKSLFILGTVLICICFCACSLLSTIVRCERLKKTPNIILYPNSQQIEVQNIKVPDKVYSFIPALLGINNNPAHIVSTYSVRSEINVVLNFYSSFGICNNYDISMDQYTCMISKANSNSNSIYVYLSSNNSRIILITYDIRWFSCGSHGGI